MRRRSLLWLLAIVCLGMAVLGGWLLVDVVRFRSRLEKNYQYQVTYLETTIQEDGLAESILAGRKRALRLLRMRQLAACPEVLAARVWLKDGEEPRLWIEWVESDLDFQGIRLRETSLPSGEMIVEDYPVFANSSQRWRRKHWIGPWRSIQFLPVQFRTGPEQRKDMQKWKQWVEKPNGDGFPPAPIWVTKPSGECRVELGIYDAAGHVSRFIPVDFGGGTQVEGTDTGSETWGRYPCFLLAWGSRDARPVSLKEVIW